MATEFSTADIPTPGDKKREISPRLNAIIANVWGADQVKNREIIENVWKILPEMVAKNGRFPAKTEGLESLRQHFW